jgi:hypothetical protein
MPPSTDAPVDRRRLISTASTTDNLDSIDNLCACPAGGGGDGTNRVNTGGGTFLVDVNMTLFDVNMTDEAAHQVAAPAIS